MNQETPEKRRLASGEEASLLEVILESIAEGVFTIDREGRITTFNRAAEEITGFRREEAIGRWCFEVFRADICQRDCALRRTIETGRPIVGLQVTILDKQGREVPVSITTAVLRDARGEVIGGVETFRDLSLVEELRREATARYTLQDIVSKSPRVQEILNILPDVAESESTVLITGESGTGKELLARAIHELSPRREGPYVRVNCAAIPETLLESELFGYVRGAFTDARRDKPGRFTLAQGGTILLDEVGEVPLGMQAKLLRVLQEREYEPLGGTRTLKADVRVIATTNRDLTKLVREGRFREDLYWRLKVIHLHLPPLRERREDIPLLAETFVHRLALRTGKPIRGLSPEAMEVLMRWPFPGNIRELQNAIEHAFILCKEELIRPEHLPSEMRRPEILPTFPPVSGLRQEAERRLLEEALARCEGNRSRAAKLLGISRTTLWRKMRRYGLFVSK